MDYDICQAVTKGLQPPKGIVRDKRKDCQWPIIKQREIPIGVVRAEEIRRKNFSEKCRLLNQRVLRNHIMVIQYKPALRVREMADQANKE